MPVFYACIILFFSLVRLFSGTSSGYSYAVDASSLKDASLTYEEYLELFGKVSDSLGRTHQIEDKDRIVRKFFLNFTVKGEMHESGKQIKQWSVVDFQLKEPFATFAKGSDVLLGRDITTDTEPSLELLYRLLTSYDDIRFRHERLKRLIATAVKPESITSQEYLV